MRLIPEGGGDREEGETKNAIMWNQLFEDHRAEKLKREQEKKVSQTLKNLEERRAKKPTPPSAPPPPMECDDVYEDDDDEPLRPPVPVQRRRKNITTFRRKAVKKRGEEDYLTYCRQAAAALNGVSATSLPDVYDTMGKRYKRAFVKGLNSLVGGEWSEHMTPKEKQTFKKNRAEINSLKSETDSYTNPFKKAPEVGKMAFGIFGELASPEDEDVFGGVGNDFDDGWKI